MLLERVALVTRLLPVPHYRLPGTVTTSKADRQPPTSPRALSAAERETVRATLNSDRFVDCSPREVYGTLLDEGVFLCSTSTMYRILQANDEVRERRNQKRHPAYVKAQFSAILPSK